MTDRTMQENEMPQKKPDHTLHLEIEPGWGLNLKLVCSWEPDDSTRPCWPHTETGEPYETDDASEVGCVYESYVSEVGIKIIHGAPMTLIAPVHVPHWEAGYPHIVFGGEPE